MRSVPQRTVWLVIPSYNDSERLANYLPDLCLELEPGALAPRVQVVDDGSTENEKRRLEELVCQIQSRYPFVQAPVFLGKNQGKGGAILRGWEEAADAVDWLGFLDADGATPAYEVRRLIGRLENRGGVSLFASRIQMRGRKVERSLKRHLAGRIFASLVGRWIDPHVYDSQCGFKLIPAEAYRKVKPLLREKRFAFDVELLAALNHHGCPVEEVPVDWTDIPGSKVSLVRDSLRMFLSVRTLRSRMASWPVEI